jgi:hypothetical protein
MSMTIGGAPGRVYTPTEMTNGTAPAKGQKYAVTGGGSEGTKEYIMCEAAASQNLTNGLVVTMDGSFIVTVAAANGEGNTSAKRLGVVVATRTVSVSSGVWVQVYGKGNVACSVSALPGVGLKVGSVAGNLDDDAAASASSMVRGIILTATSSTTGVLTACFIDYPAYGPTNVV